MLRMSAPVPSLRFVDTWMARLSVCILALVALLAMAISDNLAYSQVPLLMGLVIVVCLILWGLIRGAKIPAFSSVVWLSLLSGFYFLWRASTSYAVLEGYADMGLILACMVFYVMGFIFAQSPRAGKLMSLVIVIALMLNVVFLVLMRMPQLNLSLNFLGRADVGLTGPHSRHSAFFLYKNFAAFFFVVGGVFVLCRQFWQGHFSMKSVALALFAIFVIGFSFLCSSRVVYIILPFVLCLAWFLSFILRIHSGRSVRWFDIMFFLLSLASIGGALLDFVYGHELRAFVMGIDTHLRFMIWGDILKILPDAPLIGYGAGAAQWEIIPIFNEWNSPNYAHNEYLQLWADYGIIGLVLGLSIVFIHAVSAYATLSMNALPDSRRILVQGALLILLSLSIYAFLDFPWHQFALLSLSAFCCGIVVSPVSGKGYSQLFFSGSTSAHIAKKSSLKAQGAKGKVLLMISLTAIAVALSFLIIKHAPVLKAQWEYDFALKDASYDEAARERILLDAFDRYPEVNIVTRIMSGSRLGVDVDECEAMMLKSLEYNPKQLFMRVNLSELMERKGNHAAVESMLRDAYTGDGMPACRLTWWPTYYGYNLLVWGTKIKAAGEHGKAFSILDHALSMHAHMPLIINTTWRNVARPWNEGMDRPGLRELLRVTKDDVAFYRMLGIKKDDRWKEPMREGGKTAIYSWTVKLGVKKLLDQEQRKLAENEKHAKKQAVIWKRKQAAEKKEIESKKKREEAEKEK